MRILVVTFYYPPDLSAGSFRIEPIVKALLAHRDVQVDVVTTSPNRYGSFSADAPSRATVNGANVSRIPVQKHKSGMFDQPLAFIRFALGAMREVRGKQYDLVFATSSRLMTAALAALIATRKKTKLYLDIRDIFSDTIREIAPGPIAVLSAPLFSWLERWTVSKASTVSLVSPGFSDYFTQRFPRTRFVFFTNGVDDDFTIPESGNKYQHGDGVRTVVYAGNIGEGQGLEQIIPALAERTRGKFRFRIIGDGGRKARLESEIAKLNLDNVEMISPLKRDALVRAYNEADVLFLHLNDYKALHKVLPSKIFEYAATGKPILAGVAGFSAKFIEAEIENATVFPPLDTDRAFAALTSLHTVPTDRTAFVAKYRRGEISRSLANDIMTLAGGKSL